MGTVVMSQQGIIKFETREKAPKSGGFFYNTYLDPAFQS